jgi:colanic acid biosynthesis glycosyl transferase WcaI
MNLLIVTQYFWPEPFRINDLVSGLRERGHSVEVLTGMPNYPAGRLYPGYGWFAPAREEYAGAPVYRTPLVTRGQSKNWRLILNYLSFAFSACITGPLRCVRRYDAVLIYQPSPITVALPGLLMAALSRAPALLWIQDLWPDTLEAVGVPPRSLLAGVAAALSRFLHRHCAVLLVQSKALAPRLVAQGIDRKRIEYLPNWAEEYYRPLALAGGEEDPLAGIAGFRIVFAGNLGSAQSLETVITAASLLRHVREIQWVICGDGNMRGWLETEIARRDLTQTVRLYGWRPPETMPVLFAHADALLVTLRADPVFALTIPSKLQTYLACGKPVIAALDGEGGSVIRESGGGVVCAAADGAGLAEAVQRLYRMPPAERVAMGKRGRAYYDANFERSALLTRLEERIADVMVKHDADIDTRR